MVGGDDDQRVGVSLLEFHADVDGVIKRDLVVQRGRGIAGVARVIHAPALDLQDEVLLVFEFLQRAAGHHGERGHGGLELGVDALIEGEGKVTEGENAEPPVVVRRLRQLLGERHHLVARLHVVAAHVALVLALGGIEKFLSAAEQHLDAPVQILRGDGFRRLAFQAAGDEARGRGVRDFGGGHQPALPALLPEQFVERGEHLAVGENVHRAVHDARAAAPARGRGGGIGDEGVERAHVHQARLGARMIVELHPGQAALPQDLREMIRARQRPGAHAVGDHVDDVARLLAGARGGIRGATDERKGERARRHQPRAPEETTS